MSRSKTLGVSFVAVAVLLLAIALPGCAERTVRAPMDTTLKWKPLAAQIPLRIGLYESPEFRQCVGESHSGRLTVLLPIGESSSGLINQVLSAMFADVVQLDHWPPDPKLGLAAGISPEIRHHFTGISTAPVQVTYGFTFYCSRLGSETSWTIEAEGLSNATLARFTSPLANSVAIWASTASTAVKNAMAIFMIGFRHETAVRECLGGRGNRRGKPWN